MTRCGILVSCQWECVQNCCLHIFLWLLRPYLNVRNLDPTKVQFNTVLSKIHVIVERTLVLLKGWWRCLQKELEILTETSQNDSCLLYSSQHLH